MLRVTYEIITPESSEQGDAEERGFIEPRFGMRVPIEEVMANSQDWPDEALAWSVGDVERAYGRNSMEDSGRWFSTLDPERDYQTGAETFYSIHPPREVTAASYERLARIFQWRRAD